MMEQPHDSRESSTRYNQADYILNKYVNVLDTWQREVDDIRHMHHDVWAKTQPSDTIIQHRTGSRVEKQTRVVGKGKQTNIDFMFEVNGISIDCKSEGQPSGLYFKSNQNSVLFGRIYVAKEMRNDLQVDSKYSVLFTDKVFCWDENEQAFLIKPSIFRDNVMSQSGFDYKREKEISKNSPSIPGKGIVNKYDAVPCLRLKKWPESLLEWTKAESEVFPSDWKTQIACDHNFPLFLVPTGNPNSDNFEDEFRLSFSMAEVACFSQINEHIRKLFGVTKYVFQSLFGSIDLLSWFHVKHLLLHMVDKHYASKFASMSPLKFVFKAMEEISYAVTHRSTQHFFINSCNIFPKYKHTDESEAAYKKIFSSTESNVLDLIESHLQSELKITNKSEWFEGTKTALAQYEGEGLLQKYVNGYLTRLLSVITFPLGRNETDKTDNISKIQETFSRFSQNKNIVRLKPMVNPTIRRIVGDSSFDIPIDRQRCPTSKEDELSILAHEVFECLIKDQSLANISKLLPEKIDDVLCDHAIGVSVSRYHKDLFSRDVPLQHVMESLENMYGTCPRFYIHPTLLLKHVYMLHYFAFQLPKDGTNAIFLKHFEDLINISLKMSSSSPYFWKLSYRFSAMYLLDGYKVLLKDNNIHYEYKFDLDSEIKSFKTLQDCTCFDLK